MTRLVVADDHRMFREGLCALLEASGLQVVAEVGDGDALLAAVAEHRPDIALLDIEMPGPGAAELVRTIRRAHAPTLPVVVTMHSSGELVAELEQAGAAAYIAKSVGHRALVAALQAVTADAGMVTIVPSSVQRTKADVAGLTPREVEVLALLARARTNRQISDELFLSEATVKRHLTNLYRTLGATSRVDAVNIARRRGLVT